MLGIRVKENFNYPFLAKNLSDFWNRWHISLSEWCKDYVFIPIWAAFHGVGIIIWDGISRFSFIKIPQQMTVISRIFSIFICIHFVIFSFVWIKENNINQAINSLFILIGLGS